MEEYLKQNTVPVLFIIFNRFEETRLVLQSIRKQKPRKLYISSDGPRESIKDERVKIEKLRAYVLEKIDWDCELYTLFHSSNLGCGVAVSSAISWFFENEEEGIILEDDCLPSQAFFEFCKLGLNAYRYDYRVFSVGGTNLISNTYRKSVFSLHGTIWGWATWKDRWKLYNYDCYPTIFELIRYSTSLREFILALRTLRFRLSKQYNSWDYQWLYTRIKHNGLTLLPKNNYIKNIGFNSGTHHLGKLEFKCPPLSNKVVFKKTEKINRDLKYDSLLFNYKNS